MNNATTCDAMLVRMLDAEPGELEGRGGSALAVHVRTCPRCGAVAAGLVADTRQLAAAVAAGAVPRAAARNHRPFRPAAAVATTLIAASLIVAALLRNPARTSNSPDVTSAVPGRSSGVFGSDAPHAVQADSVTRVAVPGVAAHRYADAAPVLPTPAALAESTDVSLVDSESPLISVEPPPGVRAAILRTNTPGITVVWLY